MSTSPEELLLRQIFEYVGIPTDMAQNAQLQTYVEWYRDKQKEDTNGKNTNPSKKRMA